MKKYRMEVTRSEDQDLYIVEIEISETKQFVCENRIVWRNSVQKSTFTSPISCYSNLIALQLVKIN